MKVIMIGGGRPCLIVGIWTHPLLYGFALTKVFFQLSQKLILDFTKNIIEFSKTQNIFGSLKYICLIFQNDVKLYYSLIKFYA